MNDLISRSAAIETAFKGADDWDGGFNPKYLNELPAVDAVPVVHARWRELNDGTEECTNCHGLCPHEENYNGDVIFNFDCEYCPWCGAKMDG